MPPCLSRIFHREQAYLFEVSSSLQQCWYFLKKIHMGNGKTSIMQIIKNTLSAKTPQVTHNIWFNTWQFSQFNMDDDLAVSLLSCLLNELAQSEEQ